MEKEHAVKTITERPYVKNGIWIPLSINKEIKSVFQCMKIQMTDDATVITYLVYDPSTLPLDTSYQVRIIFKSPIHAMRMSTESSSFMDDKLRYFREEEDRYSWMGEVRDSHYLRWFKKASCTDFTGFYDDAKHYVMDSWEDIIEVITNKPPEFRVLTPRKSLIYGRAFYRAIVDLIDYMKSFF